MARHPAALFSDKGMNFGTKRVKVLYAKGAFCSRCAVFSFTAQRDDLFGDLDVPGFEKLLGGIQTSHLFGRIQNRILQLIEEGGGFFFAFSIRDQELFLTRELIAPDAHFHINGGRKNGCRLF